MDKRKTIFVQVPIVYDEATKVIVSYSLPSKDELQKALTKEFDIEERDQLPIP